MVGLVPMMPMLANISATCMTEVNSMDSAEIWTPVISSLTAMGMALLPLNQTTPMSMMTIASSMSATCTTWTEKWSMS